MSSRPVTHVIHQIHPLFSADALDDDQLLALYASHDREGPVVRANFVSSIDGSSTAGGVSGPLGGPADKRVFDLLRRLCDVVLVAAGTIRAEGYGAMELSSEASKWRVNHGLSGQPHFAIVSARLDIDADSDVFTAAPVRPLVLTVDDVDPNERRRLERVAEVISCGHSRAGGKEVVGALTARGLNMIHCEGGPRFLGTLMADDLLDELCLTISPFLEGGHGPRIVSEGSADPLLRMTLDHALISADMIFTKYSRTR